MPRRWSCRAPREERLVWNLMWPVAEIFCFDNHMLDQFLVKNMAIGDAAIKVNPTWSVRYLARENQAAPWLVHRWTTGRGD